jgi:hypothetical protein
MPTAADTVSGSVIVSSNAPVVFPPGSTIVKFTAHDAAGNSATATTTVTVVDTTPPTVAIVSPQARGYLHSVLKMSFSSTDGGSGLAAMPVAALDGAAVADGQSLSLLTLGLGTHSFVASATGRGRKFSKSERGIHRHRDNRQPDRHGERIRGQHKIDDSNTVKSLLAKLNDAKQAAQRRNRTAALNKLQEFIDLVQAQSGRHITPDAAQILVADAQYSMGTLP